ncbi:MAG: hypothetical protein AAGG55_01225 [Pseudomonadota bacterium]
MKKQSSPRFAEHAISFKHSGVASGDFPPLAVVAAKTLALYLCLVSSASAKFDELVINVPYEVSLGDASNIAELVMDCRIYLDGEPSEQARVDGVVSIDANGKANGDYTFLFERNTGVSAIEKSSGRTTASLDRNFLSRFEAGQRASFSCRWSSLRRTSETATIPIETYTEFGAGGEIVSQGDGMPIVLEAGGSNSAQEIELNAGSTVFFNMTFAAADNQASDDATLMAQTSVQSDKYANVQGLPQAEAGYAGIPVPSDPASSIPDDEVRKAPSSSGDNTPLRVRVEAANICVTKSDDWGLSGTNEDVKGSFFARLEMIDADGEEVVEKTRFVSGDGSRFSTGFYDNKLYDIPTREPFGIGENSCAGSLDQLGEFIVYPGEYGFTSYQEMMARADVRLLVGGSLWDHDPSLLRRAPSLGDVVYTHRVGDLPICGVCSAGAGTAKTDKWMVLTKKRPGPNNGVMGFFLGEDKNPQTGAFGQWHYNIEMIGN